MLPEAGALLVCQQLLKEAVYVRPAVLCCARLWAGIICDHLCRIIACEFSGPLGESNSIPLTVLMHVNSPRVVAPVEALHMQRRRKQVQENHVQDMHDVTDKLPPEGPFEIIFQNLWI